MHAQSSFLAISIPFFQTSKSLKFLTLLFSLLIAHLQIRFALHAIRSRISFVSSEFFFAVSINLTVRISFSFIKRYAIIG
jgi:hypothetical protein